MTISVLFVNVSPSFLPDVPNGIDDARDRGQGFPVKKKKSIFQQNNKKNLSSSSPKTTIDGIRFIRRISIPCSFPAGKSVRYSKNVCTVVRYQHGAEPRLGKRVKAMCGRFLGLLFVFSERCRRCRKREMPRASCTKFEIRANEKLK